MAKKFPIFMKDMNPQIQIAERTPNKINLKKI